MITVKSATVTTTEPHKVILWEKDALHPKKSGEEVGEIFLTTDGKEVRVGETAAIKRLLMEDVLVKAEAKSVPKP